MRAIANLLLPLCIFAFACGSAAKPAPKPPPAAPAPPPPAPVVPPAWQSSAETCAKLMGKMIELAKAAKLDEVAENIEDSSANEEVIADCVETVNKEQFDCVMATTDFEALSDCESDEE